MQLQFGGALAKKSQPATVLPVHARLIATVMGSAGGSGRSSTAALLANSLAGYGATVVLDTAPRLSSPWPSWSSEPGAGLLSVPPDQGMTRRQVIGAASVCRGRDGAGWHVLTDHQDWSAAPLTLPEAPAAWYQLAAAGGWQAVVADTTHPIAHDTVSARHMGRAGLSAEWCHLPFAVPVLCAAATGWGMHTLQTAVQAATAEGLPLHRAVVSLVATAEGRLPAPVRAAMTMLQSRVAAVVIVPHDPHIRSHGMRDADRLKPRTAEAGAELARAVLASAGGTWGEPLPPAAVPAATAAPTTPGFPSRSDSQGVTP
ncbi:hypothetical protein [Streptomyces klenkii]